MPLMAIDYLGGYYVILIINLNLELLLIIMKQFFH